MTVTEILVMNIVCDVFEVMHVHSEKFQQYRLISAADLWKNCRFGGKSTKIGTDHAEYTRIDLS